MHKKEIQESGLYRITKRSCFFDPTTSTKNILYGFDFMMKHLITLACCLIAVGCYAAGMSTGAAIFGGAGVLFESIFWFRLFSS